MKISLSLPDELVERIDRDRGLIPRSTYIADLLRREAESAKPVGEWVRSRTSAQAKRDIKPIPKGDKR